MRGRAARDRARAERGQDAGQRSRPQILAVDQPALDGRGLGGGRPGDRQVAERCPPRRAQDRRARRSAGAGGDGAFPRGRDRRRAHGRRAAGGGGRRWRGRRGGGPPAGGRWQLRLRCPWLSRPWLSRRRGIVSNCCADEAARGKAIHGGFSGPDEAGGRAEVEDGSDAGRARSARGRGHLGRRACECEAFRQGRDEGRQDRRQPDQALGKGDRRGSHRRGPRRCATQGRDADAGKDEERRRGLAAAARAEAVLIRPDLFATWPLPPAPRSNA